MSKNRCRALSDCERTATVPSTRFFLPVSGGQISLQGSCQTGLRFPLDSQSHLRRCLLAKGAAASQTLVMPDICIPSHNFEKDDGGEPENGKEDRNGRSTTHQHTVAHCGGRGEGGGGHCGLKMLYTQGLLHSYSQRGKQGAILH